MKTRGFGEVNMYSPQMGQLQSVERSIHLCDPRIEIEMHAQHVYLFC